MKKYFYTPILVMLLTAFMTVKAQSRQEYLGLPGDNLNLFAVMKLFQESETLEAFERNLNDPESRINNLDLDGDGYVDYIRVIDNINRNVHYIVLQVAVNPRENQDVAVFTVVQQGNGQVQIQLIGDEALYGRNYIIEPIFDETPNPGYMGSRKVNGHRVNVVSTNYFEVAAWPIVRVIYMPTYVVWRSPWYYNYYPVYWRPWNPFYWHYYYGFHYNYYSYYYGHYRHWDHYRYDHLHDSYYHEHRSHSPYVATRINEGQYKSTYSRPELRREGTALYRRTIQSNTGSGARRGSTGGTTTNSSVNRGPRDASNTNVRQSTGGVRQSSGTVNRSGNTTVSGERRTSGTVSSGESTVKSTSGRTSGVTGNDAATGGRRTSTASESPALKSSGTGDASRTGGPAINNQRRSTSSGTTQSATQSSGRSSTQGSSSVSNGERRSTSGTGTSGNSSVQRSSKSTQSSSTVTNRPSSERRSSSGTGSNTKSTESGNSDRSRR